MLGNTGMHSIQTQPTPARNPSRQPARLLALSALVSGLSVALPAIATDAPLVPTTELALPTAPPLVLRFLNAEGIDENAVRLELKRVTGRATTYAQSDGLGTLTVSLQPGAGDLPSTATVVYQPPTGELSRTDVLADATSAPTRIALLAQTLLQRDVGVTVLQAPPTVETPPKVDTGDSHATLAAAAVNANPTVSSNSKHAATDGAPQDNENRFSPWSLAALFRLGAPSYSYDDGVLVEEGHGPGVGFAVRIDLPSPFIFTFGIEAYADKHSSNAGVNSTYRAEYLGAALVPSVRLSPKDWPLELRALGVAGLTRQSISESRNSWNGEQEMKSVPGKPGYRVGALIQGTGWFSEHFGLSALVGFEHNWSYVITAERTTSSSANIEFVGSWRSRLWTNLPVLQLGAVVRL